MFEVPALCSTAPWQPPPIDQRHLTRTGAAGAPPPILAPWGAVLVALLGGASLALCCLATPRLGAAHLGNRWRLLAACLGAVHALLPLPAFLARAVRVSGRWLRRIFAMGNIRSKLEVLEGREPALNHYLREFISGEGQGMSVEALEEVGALLQSALIASLRAKERRTAWLCKVCLDKEIRVSLKPCLHACLCSGCSHKVTACPICRNKITGRDFLILA